jgi:DNA-binding NtrC family response regulator
VTFVADALQKIESGIADVAIVDSKLADGSAGVLADALERRGVRYVVVSGYEKANLPKALQNAPFVPKPVSVPLLIEAIGRLTRPQGGIASGPQLARPHAEPSGAPREGMQSRAE